MPKKVCLDSGGRWLHHGSWPRVNPDPVATVCLLIQEGEDHDTYPETAFATWERGKTYPSVPSRALAVATAARVSRAAGVVVFIVQ